MEDVNDSIQGAGLVRAGQGAASSNDNGRGGAWRVGRGRGAAAPRAAGRGGGGGAGGGQSAGRAGDLPEMLPDAGGAPALSDPPTVPALPLPTVPRLMNRRSTRLNSGPVR